MATQEMIDGWESWVAERPPKVREVAERFKPWNLYRLGSSGHRVTIYSIDEPEDQDEPVTLKVLVLREYNEGLLMQRKVFGILPDELVFLEDLS